MGYNNFNSNTTNMNSIFRCAIALVLFNGICSESQTPHLSYRYSSFAVPYPDEAIEFLSKYISGYVLKPEEILIKSLSTEDSEIRGIRIPYNQGTTFADIYFIKETRLPENPKLPLEEFIQKVESAHTFSQDDWDWWQDWHIAYHLDGVGLDKVATRLMKDGVPFVTRSISFYFMIPGTSVVIQILGNHKDYWTTPFAFCRQTGDDTTRFLPRYDQNETNIHALPYPTKIPEFVPSHQSWAVADALKDYFWTTKMMPSFVPIDMSEVYGDTHEHSNGTCAQIGWLSDTGYNTMDGQGWAIHYVEQFVKRDGGLPIGWVEQLIEETRAGELGTKFEHPDAYMAFRTAFSCNNLEQMISHFQSHNEPYLLLDERMFVKTPSGKIFEIYEE